MANVGTWIDWQYLLDAASLLRKVKKSSFSYSYTKPSINAFVFGDFGFHWMVLSCKTLKLKRKKYETVKSRLNTFFIGLCQTSYRLKNRYETFEYKLSPYPSKRYKGFIFSLETLYHALVCSVGIRYSTPIRTRTTWRRARASSGSSQSRHSWKQRWRTFRGRSNELRSQIEGWAYACNLTRYKFIYLFIKEETA